jgi:hypothetical protein
MWRKVWGQVHYIKVKVQSGVLDLELEGPEVCVRWCFKAMQLHCAPVHTAKKYSKTQQEYLNEPLLYVMRIIMLMCSLLVKSQICKWSAQIWLILLCLLLPDFAFFLWSRFYTCIVCLSGVLMSSFQDEGCISNGTLFPTGRPIDSGLK